MSVLAAEIACSRIDRPYGEIVDGDGDFGGAPSGDGDGDGDTGGTAGDGDGDGDSGGMPGDGDGDTGGMSGDGDGDGSGGAGSGGDGSGGNGSGGAAIGTGPCPPYDGPETLDLVDDMPLGANTIRTSNGRKGAWLAFHGADLEMIPSPEASGLWPDSPMELLPETSSDYALHYQSTTIGAGSSQIWQQFGFLLDEGNPYDLSGYTGLMFCARRDAAVPQGLDLRITEGDLAATDDQDHDTTGGIIPVEWTYIKIPFDPEWPSSALTGAKSIWFLGGNGVEYDIWIDNIYLYTE